MNRSYTIVSATELEKNTLKFLRELHDHHGYDDVPIVNELIEDWENNINDISDGARKKMQVRKIKTILFEMRQAVNLFQNDADSKRWKHFNKWDIQESLEEYSTWFGEILKEIETLYNTSNTTKIGEKNAM